jgi:glyoxylase-like metal-dependent hydrolase (beta-lactamase superfamily II)
MSVEVEDLQPGLWIWRQPHPSWSDGEGWDPWVTSVGVTSRGVSLVLDPLAPSPAAREFWDRMEAHAPTVAVVLKPDHIRDIDLFARWYGATAYGPHLFWRHEVPQTRLEYLRAGDELPGGLLALDDGRNAQETPLYLPEHRTLVFADALTAPEGELRVWSSSLYAKRTLPILRELLELDFERVIVSHGDPVHTRADFEAALEREPWSEPEGD